VTQRYVAPTSFAEVAEALSGDATARVVAGGTDLVVGIRNGRLAAPESLVSMHALEEGRELGIGADGALQIGALATHDAIVRSPAVVARWTALADASALVGSPATRNVGSVGGNIMNASPAMELGSPLLVFEADADLLSTQGARRVPLAELLAGPRRTTAAPHEVLTRVSAAAAPPGSGSAYVRLEYRRAMEIAVVGAAALVTLADDARIGWARIALTAVAPVCLRAPEAERLLTGAPLSDESVVAAARAAAEVAAPIDDVRASAEYRRRMIPVIVRRALTAAARRARGEAIPVPATASPLAQSL
jgi:CO/xanthine dehydrogenase FAD-binding subunit